METRTRELTGSWLGLLGRRLHEVAAPTLVVVGDWDQPDHVPSAKLLAAEITGARLAVLGEVDQTCRSWPAFTDLLAGFLHRLNHPDWRRLL